MILARRTGGWVRSLDNQGELVLTKSLLLGGTVFTSTFVPNEDVCESGGESYLNAYYYETGTAYPKAGYMNDGTGAVLINGQEMTEVLDKMLLGHGKSSAIGVHVGAEGTKAFIQQSTGAVLSEGLNPVFTVKSGLISWLHK